MCTFEPYYSAPYLPISDPLVTLFGTGMLFCLPLIVPPEHEVNDLQHDVEDEGKGNLNQYRTLHTFIVDDVCSIQAHSFVC